MFNKRMAVTGYRIKKRKKREKRMEQGGAKEG